MNDIGAKSYLLSSLIPPESYVDAKGRYEEENHGHLACALL